MNEVGRASAGSEAGEAERARKIYRYVTDTARRIDEVIPACKATSDLFTTYMEGLRQKLRDNCEKLMFLDPLAYGRKSLELLWRKAYYETVSIAKKLRNKDEEYDNYIFTHIVCGIGHYHHIISRIKTEMDVEIASLDYPPMMWDDDGKEAKLNVDEDVRQWGAGIVHTCLIYLGDLSRYQSEMFDFDTSIAARYYLQAAYIDLTSGMPYNQLGNLYTDRNHNLDSVCYYVHCLSCSVPFEGAEGNLSRLFEKNAQFVESIAMEDVESLPQNERVKLTIARVLILVENWYVAKDNVDVAQLCNLTAHDLKVCLSYEEPILPDINKNYEEFEQRKEEENQSPSYLNHNIVYKMVLLCLFCIDKMSEIDANKAFAVKAFTLALLSQLLQKFLDKMLKYGFPNPSRAPRRTAAPKHDVNEELKIEEEVSKNGIKQEEQSENIKETVDEVTNGHLSDVGESAVCNGNGKTIGKKISAKRRRRRRLNSYESSDESDEDTETSSVHTEESGSDAEGSINSDESIISEDSNNELSDGEAKDENFEKKNPPESTEADSKENSTKAKTHNNSNQNGVVDEIEVQKFLRGDNFLPSLKLLQDWVLTETDLILSCGESGEALFRSVVDLLNMLQINFRKKTSKNRSTCKILEFARSAARKLELEFKVIPLPEDVNLRGTNICKFDKDAAEWDQLKKYNPSIYEENVIRILNFIHFGEQIAKIVPQIRYNRTMQIFFVKKKPTKLIRKEIKKKPQRSPPKPHAGRHAHAGDTSLMRNLGKLWLQSQVRELESAVGGGGEAPPAYLVLDTAALAQHTPLVKQLARARRFVVLVPTVVLQSIDELKKEQGGARDAIRWLETQLRSGTRFLRAQRPGETRPLPLVRHPRKAPRHVHNYIQIIEFCHHFVAETGGNGDGESLNRPKQALLVLLTGTKLSELPEEQDFSYTGVAQSAGVAVDTIVHFFAKWRHLLNKTGKKR